MPSTYRCRSVGLTNTPAIWCQASSLMTVSSMITSRMVELVKSPASRTADPDRMFSVFPVTLELAFPMYMNVWLAVLDVFTQAIIVNGYSS